MYCLWLSGKKVFTLEQLKENFDIETLRNYYLGGGLARWLEANGEQETARKVARIDPGRNISHQLAAAFGVSVPADETENVSAEAVQASYLQQPSLSSFSPVGSFASSFAPSSFYATSFSTSFSTGSFTFGGVYTSFLTGSFYHQYEYEYEYQSGSFTSTSFTLGSFSYGSFVFGSGSFAPGSFFAGSFTVKSSGAVCSQLPKITADSTEQEPERQPEPQLTPQQKFELNISSCSLNRYGYGIHLI